jgi:hypothetical protein
MFEESASEVPFACDLSVFTAEERTHLEELSVELFGTVDEVQELSDGYAFRLPESYGVMKVADFIANDHLCCPFLHHGLELEPKGGSLWLRITGPGPVKEFLIGDVFSNNLLRAEIAAAIGYKQPAS